jgi:hypothetical protein
MVDKVRHFFIGVGNYIKEVVVKLICGGGVFGHRFHKNKKSFIF